MPGVRFELISEGEGMPAMERSAGTVRLEEHAVAIAGVARLSAEGGAATGGGSDVSYAVHRHSWIGWARTDRRARSRTG